MIYGYARVSTDGQSVAAQVAALKAGGAEKVFREVASGAKTDQAQLRRLLDTLAPGDVLTVTRLDRLARSTRDLLNTLANITAKDAGFRSLGDTWADTTTAHGRLMLTVLGGLAEFERELIRVRTGEGRERAKARGVKLGRKPKLTDHQRKEAIARRESGEETLAEIGRSYNVSGWTISRLAPSASGASPRIRKAPYLIELMSDDGRKHRMTLKLKSTLYRALKAMERTNQPEPLRAANGN